MKPVLTILIVDDDEGHSLLIHENLAEQVGPANRIEHLRNGQAALDFFFGRADCTVSRIPGPYLILLDIRMPKVDGIEVLRRIKMDPEFKKLPVVMLSTNDDSRDVDICHALGCSAYIKKPIDYELFAEAIRHIGQFSGMLLIPEIGGW